MASTHLSMAARVPPVTLPATLLTRIEKAIGLLPGGART